MSESKIEPQDLVLMQQIESRLTRVRIADCRHLVAARLIYWRTAKIPRLTVRGAMALRGQP